MAVGEKLAGALTDSMPFPDAQPHDRDGRMFDPSMHVANPDGTPKLYNGKLRRKRGLANGEENETETSQQDETALGHAMGQTIAIMFAMFANAEPPKEMVTGMGAAWANYFRAKGISNVPPEAFLVTAHVPLVIWTIQQPQSQGRIRGFIYRWRHRRDARFNMRDNGYRENDASDATSDRVS